MKKSRALLAALLAAASLAPALALAQDHRPGGPDAAHGQMQHGGPGDHPAIEHRPMRGNGHAYGREQPPGGPVRPGPVVNYDENHHHDWRRGERVPAEYRDRQYVIDDWRAYHLAQPPRGYEWIGIGGDHLLVQICSGVVFQIGL